MEGSSHFSVPRQGSDESDFMPILKLPEHLDELSNISKKLRAEMTPVMKAIIELTDKMALRSAALPHNQ